MTHPIITDEIQKDFEGYRPNDYVPNICGIYGRACRKLNESTGANGAICRVCGLRNFAKLREENNRNE